MIEKWTVIATQGKDGRWYPERRAAMTVQEAKEMREAGALLTSLRRSYPGGPMEFLVKSPAAKRR
ncbi:hypothetical protein [Microcystis phage MJing1]|nr:hypothetical protein [Microcystis phage MJing1]